MNKLNNVATSGEPLHLGVSLMSNRPMNSPLKICHSNGFIFMRLTLQWNSNSVKSWDFLSGTDVDGMLAQIDLAVTYGVHAGIVPEVHDLFLGNPLFHKLFSAFESFDRVLAFLVNVLESRGFFPKWRDMYG